nr:hypothetical protein [Candidatus Sigynarchaeum springense]
MEAKKPMSQAIPAKQVDPRLECFSCGEPTTLSELLLVDNLIEASPCFKDISENFAHCTGDDSVFHDNVVNCCPACYAAIVESVAPIIEASRRAEIANLARALRSRPDVPVRAIITLERLVTNLVEVGPDRGIAHEDVVEAIYCAASPHYATLA